jgi:hypothetical protein
MLVVAFGEGQLDAFAFDPNINARTHAINARTFMVGALFK